MSDKLNFSSRPRRNRKNPAVRGLIRETVLQTEDLIYPLFLHSDDSDVALESMPDCHRWSLRGLVEEVGRARDVGVNSVVLFPAIPEELKTSKAEECYNPDGLVPAAIRVIKEEYPDISVITDVALDPYNSDGHDGVVEVDSKGELHVVNDETVSILCKQALCHAEAGADIVAPSDMMDGRIAEIRRSLDLGNFETVSIMSYAAKYASAYYGPFRGALDSAPKAGDKKTYQMDPANHREAVREAKLDEAEGADILMVKPAGPYLDIISKIRAESDLPLAAYQVSGEYLMIKSASKDGWIDESKVAMESLIGIKRAGADMILTYFAKKIAGML